VFLSISLQDMVAVKSYLLCGLSKRYKSTAAVGSLSDTAENFVTENFQKQFINTFISSEFYCNPDACTQFFSANFHA